MHPFRANLLCALYLLEQWKDDGTMVFACASTNYILKPLKQEIVFSLLSENKKIQE